MHSAWGASLSRVLFYDSKEGNGRSSANPGRVRRLVSAVAATVAALALTSSAGAVNPQLAGVQIALRQHGLYRGPIDGVQGPRTVRAIRVFQQRHGLAVDGLVGPRTRGALGPGGRPLFGTRVIRRGMRGYDVGVLQFLLRRHGLRIRRLDGRFGRRTAAAVRRFQRRAGLTADGVVGPRTARRLCALPVCAWRAARRPARGATRTHRISHGETLTSISRSYGVSVHAIARANRLDPRRYIIAGARIRIPGSPALMAITQTFDVRAAIDYWSRIYAVDPRLVRGVAWWESGFNNSLVSASGAQGVMQVTPETWDYVETVLVGRRIPRTTSGNVQVGVAFLRQLLTEFGGDVRLALAAYVQGPRSVRLHGLFRNTERYVAGVLALSSRL
jgi:peptidoglycan hydrolase-like protein with peptidoglycan-binding domain/LysM repeat protein